MSKREYIGCFLDDLLLAIDEKIEEKIDKAIRRIRKEEAWEAANQGTITVAETCKFLGLSRNYVIKHLIQKGKLTYLSDGKHLSKLEVMKFSGDYKRLL